MVNKHRTRAFRMCSMASNLESSPEEENSLADGNDNTLTQENNTNSCLTCKRNFSKCNCNMSVDIVENGSLNSVGR